MPSSSDHYEVQPDGDGTFKVVNTVTGHVSASGVSKTDATKQWRLLQAIKHDPGFKPDPDAVSNLKHTPGPGKYPGTGYSKTRRNPGGKR